MLRRISCYRAHILHPKIASNIIVGTIQFQSISFSTSTMSWMDSWSRPSANSKVPAPLYLSHTDIPYCHTCGRVMTSKKAPKKHQEIKYCSDRCRSRKPGAKDRTIEKKIASLLDGEQESGIETTGARSRVVKGDHRMVVTCDEIEAVVFGSRFDPEKVFGRRKNRRTRALGDQKEWKSVDMESSSDTDGEEASVKEIQYLAPSTGTAGDTVPFRISHVRPSQMDSEINFNAGGGERSKAEKIEESESDLAKRLEGAKRAEEREMVRRAARRVIIFGIQTERQDKTISSKAAVKAKSQKNIKTATADEEDDPEPEINMKVRKAEALMNGVVVEPSFAKGDWSIRWRE